MKYKLILLFTLVQLVVAGCGDKNNIKGLLATNSKANHGFVDDHYFKVNPLADLVNMPDYTDLEQSFQLTKDGYIQIYAVGELIYNLADADSRYYFKGDDIELFFCEFDADGRKKKERNDVFSFSDAESIKGGKKSIIKSDGARLRAQLKKTPGGQIIYTKISYPWNALGIRNNSKIGFEVAVGDNDDHFKQKSKISLYTKRNDPLYYKTKSYGNLVFEKGSKSHKDGSFYSIFYPHKLSDQSTEDWKVLPAAEIQHIVTGTIQNKYDLSANVRSSWDTDSLYFFLEIQDKKLIKMTEREVRNEQTFADYGWIENEKGEKIWTMNALDSKYAGGALKNHKIAKRLYLKAGKYVVKYTTDESHSTDHWDSPPPETPFYGIIIYPGK